MGRERSRLRLHLFNHFERWLALPFPKFASGAKLGVPKLVAAIV
jgi:hypothetical protein